MNRNVRFKCFTKKACGVDVLNRRVDDYIQSNLSDGYVITDKTVDVTHGGNNSLIGPTITITIWMRQAE